MVSQGVPMLAHGDELGRTQRGNNNVYSQDNEISWVNWDLDADQKELLDVHLGGHRAAQGPPGVPPPPVLRRRRRARRQERGRATSSGFKPDGAPMDDEDWNSGFARSLMVFLNGDAIPELDQMGRQVVDDHFLLLFNAHSEPITFTLPSKSFGNDWRVRLDTATGAVDPAGERPWRARSKHQIEGHSMVVLSTAVVPQAERAASEQRAQLAMSRVAKESGTIG